MEKDKAICPYCGNIVVAYEKLRRKYLSLKSEYNQMENLAQIEYDILKRFLSIPELKKQFEDDLDDKDLKKYTDFIYEADDDDDDD